VTAVQEATTLAHREELARLVAVARRFGSLEIAKEAAADREHRFCLKNEITPQAGSPG
jgi:hypothetical protein